jgi:hypothetical protein
MSPHSLSSLPPFPAAALKQAHASLPIESLDQLAKVLSAPAGAAGWTLLLTAPQSGFISPQNSAAESPALGCGSLVVRLPSNLSLPVRHCTLLTTVLEGLHTFPSHQPGLTTLDEVVRFLFAWVSRRLIERGAIACGDPGQTIASLERDFLQLLNFADPAQASAQYFRQHESELVPLVLESLSAEAEVPPEALTHWLHALLEYASSRGEERLAVLLQATNSAPHMRPYPFQDYDREAAAGKQLLHLSQLLTLYRPVLVILDLLPPPGTIAPSGPQRIRTINELRLRLPPSLTLVGVVHDLGQTPPEKPRLHLPAAQAKSHPAPSRFPRGGNRITVLAAVATLGLGWFLGRHSTSTEAPPALARLSPAPPRPVSPVLSARKSAAVRTSKNQLAETLEAEITARAATPLPFDPSDLDRLMAEISSLPNAEKRSELRAALLSQIALLNPDQAIQLTSTIPYDERTWVAHRVGTVLMSRDPAEGANFQLAHTPTDQLSSTYAMIISRWVATDANAAATWLISQPQTPDLDAARSSFAKRVAHRDPEVAMAWALEITEISERSRAVEGVYLAWMVKDSVSAEAALEKSGLGPEVVERLRSDPPSDDTQQ